MTDMPSRRREGGSAGVGNEDVSLSPSVPCYPLTLLTCACVCAWGEGVDEFPCTQCVCRGFCWCSRLRDLLDSVYSDRGHKVYTQEHEGKGGTSTEPRVFPETLLVEVLQMETTQTHLPFGLHHFIAKVVQAGHGKVTKQPPGVVHPCQQACPPAIRAPMSGNVHLCSPFTLECEPQLHPCPNSKTVVKDRGMSTVTTPRRRLELDTLRGR